MGIKRKVNEEIPYSRMEFQDVEQMIIGGCVAESVIAVRASGRLEADHFTHRKYKEIFTAIKNSVNRGIVDQIEVAKFAKSNGLHCLIFDMTVAEEQFLRYMPDMDSVFKGLAVLERAKKSRDFYEACNRASYMVMDSVENLEEAFQLIVESCRGSSGDEWQSLSDVAKAAIKEKPKETFTTGVEAIDRRFWAAPGHVTIIGGLSGAGKTSLGHTILRHLDEGGVRCALFSLEMSARETLDRIASADASVPVGAKDSSSIARLRGAFKAFSEKSSNLSIYDGSKVSMTIGKIQHLTESLYEKGEGLGRRGPGPQVVMIDYYSLLESGYDEKSWNRIAIELREMANTMKVWVIVLAQLKRYEDRLPCKEDVYFGGPLYRAADSVLLIHKEEEDEIDNEDGSARTIVIDKMRSGATGKCTVRFAAEFCSFV